MTQPGLRFQNIAPLYEKEYRLFIVARFFYTMALRMVAAVVAYKLFQITRDSFSIGLVGLSEFVPVFVLALYAGYKIDRSDKRTLLLKGIFLYAICIIGLIVVTTPAFEVNRHKSFLEISFYVIIFFTGVIRSFAGPTSNAIIAQLVPRNMNRSNFNFKP
jgi:MFS family permease